MRRNLDAKRIAAIALIAAAAMAFGSRHATARPHGGGMCGAHGAMLEKLERDVAGLGLEQKELDAAYQLIDQARRDKRPLDGEVRTAHEQMRTLLEQDQPNVDAVTSQAEKIGSLTTQARKIELRTVVQVRNLLTPEQRKQLDGMSDRFARGGARRGPPEL